jgi:hypothetical protein
MTQDTYVGDIVKVFFGQLGGARCIAVTHEGGVVRLRTRIDSELRFDELDNTVGATNGHVRPVDLTRQRIDRARVIIRGHETFHAKPQAKFGDNLSALEYRRWRRRGRDSHGRRCNIRIIRRICLTQKDAPIGKSCGFGRQHNVVKGNVAFFTQTIAIVRATVRMRNLFAIYRHKRQG